jgi:hypothetical protein
MSRLASSPATSFIAALPNFARCPPSSVASTPRRALRAGWRCPAPSMASATRPSRSIVGQERPALLAAAATSRHKAAPPAVRLMFSASTSTVVSRGLSAAGGAKAFSLPASAIRTASPKSVRSGSSPAGGDSITLGLRSPSGSKARLIARNAASSTGLKARRICSRFAVPMPCSPVSVPPRSSAASAISSATFSTVASWAGS